MKPEEIFALLYFGSGVVAAILPDGKPGTKGRLDFGWVFVALLFGPIALLIAWSTRQENLRMEEARRENERERKREGRKRL